MRRTTFLRRACAMFLAIAPFALVNAHQVRAQTKEPIIVGGTLGLTGPFAGPSAEYKFVYDYWQAEVNASGGLLGRPIKLLIYNDEGVPTTAQSLYQRLLDEDKVDLVLAPFTTFVGGAILPIVMSHKMVLFNGGFVGINLFDAAGGWMFGTYTHQEPDYTRGLFEMIDKLPASEKPSKIAILTAQNPFPIIVRDGYHGVGGALKFAEDRHMAVVMNEEYPSNTADFTGLLQRVKQSGADMLLALTTPNDGLSIVRTAYQVALKPKIICACGSEISTLPAFAKLGAAANGIISTTIASSKDNYPGYRKLAAMMRTHGYVDIPTYATVAYSILQVLEQAVRQSGTLDQAKLREYMLHHDFETANGKLHFGATGTPAYSQLNTQWQGTHNVMIWPPDRATGKVEIPIP